MTAAGSTIDVDALAVGASPVGLMLAIDRWPRDVRSLLIDGVRRRGARPAARAPRGEVGGR